MNALTAIWIAIPRKVKYAILTLILFGVKKIWPDMPLPDPDTIIQGGGVLLGGHIVTDVATNFGAGKG